MHRRERDRRWVARQRIGEEPLRKRWRRTRTKRRAARGGRLRHELLASAWLRVESSQYRDTQGPSEADLECGRKGEKGGDEED